MGVRPLESRTRVAVLDRAAEVRLGLKALLAQDDRLEVVWTGDGSEHELPVDDGVVLIADPFPPTGDPLLVQLASLDPDRVSVLVYTATSAPADVVRALGIPCVKGYLLKAAAPAVLQDAVVSLGRGQMVVPVELAAEARRHEEIRNAVPSLSPRETQVLRLLAEGLTQRQIAEELVLSPNTVKAYTAAVYRKLGVSSAVQASRVALQAGIVIDLDSMSITTG